MRRWVMVLLLAALPVAAMGQGRLLPAGPLSTQGNQMIGADGVPVRILAVGVFTDVTDKVAAIAAAGFNTMRVEWNNRTIRTQLSELDRLVAAARVVGLKVILDDHFNEGLRGQCVAQQANGLWYDLGGGSDGMDGCGTRGTVTDQRFVDDWKMVAAHFKGNDTVIGYDLWNEPLAYNSSMSTWQPGAENPEHNIRYMYQRVGDAILAIDPRKLIICEGPERQHDFADGETPAPWGDLSLAGRYPVRLSVDRQLVYSIHDYPREIGGFATDSGPLKVQYMNKVWGYLVTNNIAPVWIGEMGANMVRPSDWAWANTLIAYANGRDGEFGGPTFGPDQEGIGIDWWWAGYGAHSGDQPSGIFIADGGINRVQQSVYLQFSPARIVDTNKKRAAR